MSVLICFEFLFCSGIWDSQKHCESKLIMKTNATKVLYDQRSIQHFWETQPWSVECSKCLVGLLWLMDVMSLAVPLKCENTSAGLMFGHGFDLRPLQ